MKILTIANHKGGVGKSSTSVQFAYFLAILLKKKVLFLDFDHQKNSTKTITKSGKAYVTSITTLDIFQGRTTNIEHHDFVLVPGHRDLTKLIEQGKDAHNMIATNLKKFLDAVENAFDVCVIDTNGNPDIRLTSALACTQYVLSPIQLNQEAIDGIGDLIADIKKFKRINPQLEFLGIVPNMVEAKPFQKANFEQIVTHYPNLLIMSGDSTNDFVHIPMRSIIPEAQASGQPIWEIKKTSAREAWRDLEKYFHVIKTKIGVN